MAGPASISNINSLPVQVPKLTEEQTDAHTDREGEIGLQQVQMSGIQTDQSYETRQAQAKLSSDQADISQCSDQALKESIFTRINEYKKRKRTSELSSAQLTKKTKKFNPNGTE